MKIHKLLKLLRANKGIKQKYIQEWVSKDMSTISLIENGKRTASVIVIKGYCDMAGIKMSDFFRIIEESRNQTKVIRIRDIIEEVTGG